MQLSHFLSGFYFLFLPAVISQNSEDYKFQGYDPLRIAEYSEISTTKQTITIHPATTRRKRIKKTRATKIIPRTISTLFLSTTFPPNSADLPSTPEPTQNIIYQHSYPPSQPEPVLLLPTSPETKLETDEIKNPDDKKSDIPWYRCEKPERSGSSSSLESYFTGFDYCIGECPRFEVVCRTKIYEVRKYPETTWAYTTTTSTSYNWASRQITRLHKYFDGENGLETKLSPTSPVLTQIKKHVSIASQITSIGKKKDYTILFYIPQSYHWYTPTPRDNKIQIRKLSSQTIFALVSDELKTESTIEKTAEKFKTQLQNNKEEFLNEYYYANFDKASSITHHNEIWVPMRPGATAACERYDKEDFIDYGLTNEIDEKDTTSIKIKVNDPSDDISLIQTENNGDKYKKEDTPTISISKENDPNMESIKNVDIKNKPTLHGDDKKENNENDYDINISGVHSYDRESDTGTVQKVGQESKLINSIENIFLNKPSPKPTLMPIPKPALKIVKIDRLGEAVKIHENDIVFEKGVKIIKTSTEKQKNGYESDSNIKNDLGILVSTGAGIKSGSAIDSAVGGDFDVQTGSEMRNEIGSNIEKESGIGMSSETGFSTGVDVGAENKPSSGTGSGNKRGKPISGTDTGGRTGSEAETGITPDSRNRPGSGTENDSRPGSGPGSEQGTKNIQGSRPGSDNISGSEHETGNIPGTRPGIGNIPGIRPGTGSILGNEQATGNIPGSGPGSGSLPESEQGTGNRPESDQGNGNRLGSRPGTGNIPGSEQGTSNIPGTGNRPGTNNIPGSEQGTGNRPGSEQGTGNRPGSSPVIGSIPGSEEGAINRPGSRAETDNLPGNEQGSVNRPESRSEIGSIPGSELGTGNRPGSRPGSQKETSNRPGTGNIPGSGQGTGNKPGSEQETGNRPGSEQGTGNRPGSEQGTGIRPGSEQGTGHRLESEQGTGYRPGSEQGTGNRPGIRPGTSIIPGSEPESRPVTGNIPGSRLETDNRPGSGSETGSQPENELGTGSKPGSGPGTDSRPDSGTQTGSRPGNGTQTGSRPGSGTQTGSTPGSGTQTGSKPESGTQTGSRPGSGPENDIRPESERGSGSRSGSEKEIGIGIDTDIGIPPKSGMGPGIQNKDRVNSSFKPGNGIKTDTVAENGKEEPTDSPEDLASLLLKLDICSGGKCPTLNILEFHRLGIQKRAYENAYFLITSPDACGYTESIKKSSEMLSSYLNGNNSRKEKIDFKEASMTIVKVSPKSSENEDCNKIYDVLYYLPDSLQVNAPWPSDPKITLRGLQDLAVYSNSILGPITDRTIERDKMILEKKLKNLDKCANPNEYFVTTYITPGNDSLKNELWMLVDETCQTPSLKETKTVESLRTYSACSARGVECPWFDQIEIHKAYEGRGYSPAKYWLTTDVKACHIDDARNLGFMRLFQYVMGENEYRSRLVMTAPTILTMRPARANTTGEQCEETFTMSYYLQSNTPPKPLNPRVYLKRIMGDVFVKVFNYTNDDSIRVALNELVVELKQDGRCYDDDEIVLAEYDQPWVPRFQTELWMFRRWCNEAEEFEAKRTDYFAIELDDLEFFDLDYSTASKFNITYEIQTDVKKPSANPEACKKTKCAPYEMIKRYDSFEERKYGTDKWVCSRYFGCDIDSVSKRSHTEIFNYFYGEDNIKNELMKNTAPMVTKMDMSEIESEDTSCHHDYTTCSLIPIENQKSIPKPMQNSKLRIQSLENENFYILSYGGYTHSERIKELVLQFRKMLDDNKLYYKDVAYSAIYDDSRRVWKRHNEIWIPRAEAPLPTTALPISSTPERKKVLLTRRRRRTTTPQTLPDELPEYI